MSFWDHLNELRGTIIKSLLVFGAFTALLAYYLPEATRLLEWPLESARKAYSDHSISLGTTAATEGFNMLVEICAVGGLMLAMPFILFFIGQFVAPALTAREKQAVLPMCASACVLFLLGAAFAFFVLAPAAVQVLAGLNLDYGWEIRWTVGSYYSLVLHLVLGLGAGFQFPLLIVMLSWLGVVSTAALRKYRRHAIVGIFIVAAVATPTTDMIIQTLFALPLCILYEIAILAAKRVERRRDGSAAAATALALFAYLRAKIHAARSSLGHLQPL
jgi:sec-independent protein translocase protein TatC